MNVLQVTAISVTVVAVSLVGGVAVASIQNASDASANANEVVPATADAEPAPAPPNADTAYLVFLDARHVGYTSDADAVTMGHRVCDAMQSEGINGWLEGTRLISLGYTGDEANVIVAASVAEYCQQFAGQFRP